MLTKQGIQTYNLVKNYNLGKYFCKHLGNLQIPKSEFNTVQNTVLNFLTNNPSWCMGVASDGIPENDFVYICEIQYLV